MVATMLPPAAPGPPGGFPQGGMPPMGSAAPGRGGGRSRSPRRDGMAGLSPDSSFAGVPTAATGVPGALIPGMNGQAGMMNMGAIAGMPNMGGLAPPQAQGLPGMPGMPPAGPPQTGLPPMVSFPQAGLSAPGAQLPGQMGAGPLDATALAAAGGCQLGFGGIPGNMQMGQLPMAAGQMQLGQLIAATAPGSQDAQAAPAAGDASKQMAPEQMMPGQLGADPMLANQFGLGQVGMGMPMGMAMGSQLGQQMGQLGQMGQMGQMGLGQMSSFAAAGGCGGALGAGMPGAVGLAGMGAGQLQYSAELALAAQQQQEQLQQQMQLMQALSEQWKILAEAEQAAKDNAKKLRAFVGNLTRYDDMKGFGFIECPESREKYGRDIFLLKSRKGDAQVGDIVSFEVEPGDKGLPQAKNVIVLKELSQHKKQVLTYQKMYTGALVTPAGSSNEASMAASGTARSFVGKVAKYNEDKGWGFLECAETRQLYNRNVFVHKDHWPDGLTEGAVVSFQVELNDKGWPQARNIILGGGDNQFMR
eukprot:TRINITY_DN102101_c0_g1_i1.p1 TRINITY_DN102101_c0_g1~~TRINITY_DN102101_c0_g1_i1.p1  ORF type:complete len:531 (+),score=156.01 TRINITY_DN102101_c0_g1_i1:102-1694(+)